jgi:hypothetical protein
MKLIIEVPLLFKLEVPDGMSEAEVRRRVWEELRDGGQTIWSSSGFALERITPKRATVWQSLSFALRDREFWKRHNEAARKLARERGYPDRLDPIESWEPLK